MEWNKQKIKGLLLVVCGGVAFYCALQRLDAVLAALGWLLGILAPFLLGGALAFILNVPMRAIERHLFPRNRKGAKLRRPLALVLTLVAVIGVLALAGLVIGPGIADAVMSIIREIPAAFQRLEHQLTALAENLQDLWPLLEEQLMKLQEEIQWQELSAKALEIAKAIGAGIVSSGGFIGGVVSGVSTFVISLIFSFYVLLQKEKLDQPLMIKTEVPEELMGYRIHKLLLQPFVENAINHGFRRMTKPCCIEITMKLFGAQLYIRIRDNGCGLPQELVNELNNKNSSDGNHVGVANVRKRLELYYGEEHEMYFESREGEGTSVHLFICAEGGRRAE